MGIIGSHPDLPLDREDIEAQSSNRLCADFVEERICPSLGERTHALASQVKMIANGSPNHVFWNVFHPVANARRLAKKFRRQESHESRFKYDRQASN